MLIDSIVERISTMEVEMCEDSVISSEDSSGRKVVVTKHKAVKVASTERLKTKDETVFNEAKNDSARIVSHTKTEPSSTPKRRWMAVCVALLSMAVVWMVQKDKAK